MAANDHSRLGSIKQDVSRDYAAYMAEIQNERNWFKRARGEWPQSDHTPPSPPDEQTTEHNSD